MRVLNMLTSTDGYGMHYYYIDGVRVSERRWVEVDSQAYRKDNFSTDEVNGLRRTRHYAYINCK